jgi:hypothetical protein
MYNHEPIELTCVCSRRTIMEVGKPKYSKIYLGDEPVQVCVSGSLNVQTPTTDVVDGLVVKHDRDIGML